MREDAGNRQRKQRRLFFTSKKKGRGRASMKRIQKTILTCSHLYIIVVVVLR